MFNKDLVLRVTDKTLESIEKKKDLIYVYTYYILKI